MTGVFTVQIADHGDNGYRVQLSRDNFATIHYSGALVVPDKFNLAKFQIPDIPNLNQYYSVRVVDQNNLPIAGPVGGFFTPHAGTGVTSFAFASCSWSDQFSASNDPVYDSLATRADSGDIQFFIHLGDMHYSDLNINDEYLYQQAYDRVFESFKQNGLWKRLPLYYIWDDHDHGPDASNKNNISRNAAITAYRRRVPLIATGLPGSSQSPYYSFTRGRARFIFTDLRSEREPNDRYESNDNRQRIMSVTQEEWLYAEFIRARNAGEIIIWANTVPWISSTANGKDDWGGFNAARRRIIEFIQTNGLSDRILIISGDMHALAYDDGSNSPGGIKVCHGGPLDQQISSKGGPYTIGPITQDFNTGWASQYGRIDITDQGGSTFNVRFRGIVVSNESPFAETEVIDVNFNLEGNQFPVALKICNQSTSYSNPEGRGDRTTSSIVLSSNFPTYTIGGDFAPLTEKTLLNGVRESSGRDFYFGNSSNPNGRFFRIDFGAGNSRLVTEIRIVKDDFNYDYSTSQIWGVWQVQGSADGSTWANIGSPQTVSLVTVSEQDSLGVLYDSKRAIFDLCNNTTAYRFYNLVLQSTSPMVAQRLFEIEFKIDAPVQSQLPPVTNNLAYYFAATDNRISIAPSTTNQVSGWFDSINPIDTRRLLNSTDAGLVRPIFLQSGANLDDAIQFSGNSRLQLPQVFSTNVATTQLNGTTVFCVANLSGSRKYSATNPGRIFSFLPPRYTASPTENDITHPNGASVVYTYDNTFFNVGLMHSGLCQWYPINKNPRTDLSSDYFSCCFKFSETDYVAYINERKVSTVPTFFQGRAFGVGAAGNSGAGGYALGKGNSTNASALAGNIAEVLIYNRLLTDQEITGVNNYLKNKYGLLDEYAGTITASSSQDESIVLYPQDTTDIIYSQGVSDSENRPGSVYLLGYNTQDTKYYPFYKFIPDREQTLSIPENPIDEDTGGDGIVGPANISNLYAWYRADENVLVNGNAVVGWNDSAGNFNLQVEAGSPTFLDLNLNNKPTIQFTNDTLKYNGNFKLSNSTVFMVLQVDNVSTYPRPISWGPANGISDTSASDGANISYGDGNTIGLEHLDSAVRIGDTNITNRPTNFFTYCTTITEVDFRSYLNGQIRTSSNQSDFWASKPFAAFSSLFRVGNGTDENHPFNGRIAEILIYNRVLSNVEIDDLQNYASFKYNLTSQTSSSSSSSSNPPTGPIVQIPYGQNLLISGTASASREPVAGSTADKAADGNILTKWYGDFWVNQWWQYDFGSNPRQITAYQLSTADDNQERDPWNWRLLASNNGQFAGEEVVVDIISGSNLPTTRNTLSRVYNCKNPPGTKYRYYRWFITSTRAPNFGIQVGEFRAFDFNPSGNSAATSYTFRNGFGPRVGQIAVSTTILNSAGVAISDAVASKLVDSAILDNSAPSFATGATNGVITLNLNEYRVVDQIRVAPEFQVGSITSGDFGFWQVQGQTHSGWVNVGPPQAPVHAPAGGGYRILSMPDNTVPYRAYRLSGIASSGVGIGSGRYQEIDLKIDNAAAPINNAANIPGRFAHWEASSGITQSLGRVSQWTDLVSSRVLTGAAAAASQPVFLTSAVNSRPAIWFNSSTTATWSPTSLTWTGPSLANGFPLNNTTAFIVMADSGSNTFSRYISWMPDSTAVNDFEAIDGAVLGWNNNSNGYGLEHRSVSAITTDNGGRSSQYFVMGATLSTGAFHLYINGLDTFNNGAPWDARPFSANSRHIRLGASNRTFTNEALNGAIAEVVIYTGVLSEPQMQSLSEYFNNKYNLYTPWSNNTIISSSVQQSAFVTPKLQKFGSEIAIDRDGSYVFVGGPEDQRIPEISQGAVWCFTGNAANGWKLFQKIISEDPEITNIGSQNIVISPDYSSIMAGSSRLPVFFSGSREDGWFFIQEIDYSGFDSNTETPIYFDSYNAATRSLFVSTYNKSPFSSGNGKVNLVISDS
jgi:alkaline phosphatase D